MLPATIASIPKAFAEIKTWTIDAWEGDHRAAARQALKDLLEHRLRGAVDAYLHAVQRQGLPDRRNGSYPRHLLTELGDLELAIPRTRTFSPLAILRQYAGRFARRAAPVERLILLAFTLGLATRKVGRALLPLLGEPVSAATVSQVAKQLDAAVAAYHRRPLADRYPVLVLDGVVLKRKTGVGAQKRVVLVALGIRPDGTREVLDFRQARAESQGEWEGFLSDLSRRGLVGQTLQLIVTDGGSGLQAALPVVYGTIPVQRCWAHKTRNVLDRVRRADQAAVKRSLHAISHAPTLRAAQQAAQRLVARWQAAYPDAVRCLTRDLPELLAFLQVRAPLPPEALRTTNAIERRFREVRRRTRPMGTFSDHTSIDRILFAVFSHENQKEGTASPFLLTQNS